ncbi:histidine phosphatase family protein [Streptomyces sp. NBC_00859]|uniref:histidine phosphatase family protein n=1 Tax=Streptomyces sp. NBC_00859 TaxID=2903682 RepID=UPI00386D37E6|nr:histidine phosphatase family protein [Streptomyces sp. NBC_00859]WSZ86708.1 histidine phosphatase family protein [Streptomyces sp. NBC_00859]
MFAETADLVIDVVPHCSSTPRDTWSGHDDARPLSEAGLRQADVLAGVLDGTVTALFSSPALRCRQSVEALARRDGVEVTPVEGLREAFGFAEPRAWVAGPFAPVGGAIGGAWAAGRAAGVIMDLAAGHRGGHVVLCSHGDIIPATLSFLAAAYALPLPGLVPRGGWYRLRVRSGRPVISSHRPHTTA